VKHALGKLGRASHLWNANLALCGWGKAPRLPGSFTSQAALGVALTGPDAAQWLNLMRLNDIGKAERVCGAQAGGVTFTISF
jgi:hypothetical protein